MIAKQMPTHSSHTKVLGSLDPMSHCRSGSDLPQNEQVAWSPKWDRLSRGHGERGACSTQVRVVSSQLEPPEKFSAQLLMQRSQISARGPAMRRSTSS